MSHSYAACVPNDSVAVSYCLTAASIENTGHPNGVPNWVTYLGGSKNEWPERFSADFGNPKKF